MLGAILVTAALMLGVYAIVGSNAEGLRTLGLGALALGLLTAFIVRQALASKPLMPLRLFRSRNLWVANLMQALMVGAFFGFFFLGSLDMQQVLHYGPLSIGLAFLPETVAMAALSIDLSARLITRFGPRRVALAGLTCIAAGLFLFARSPVNADYLRDLFPAMVLLGVGAALSFTSLSLLAMAGAPSSDSGLASGLLNTTTQVGAALGLAVLATISTSRTGQLLAEGPAIAAALSGGYHLTWALSAGVVAVTIMLGVTLLRRSATETVSAPAELGASAAEEESSALVVLEDEEICA